MMRLHFVFFFLAVFLILFSVSFANGVHATPIQLPYGQGGTGKNDDNLRHLPKINIKEIREKNEAENIYANKSDAYVLLRGLIDVVGNFLMPFLGAVAGFMLFYAGYSLVVAQSQASEEMTKQKMNVVYVLLGLVFVALAGPMTYKYIYLNEGTALLDPCRNQDTGALLENCEAILLAKGTAQELIRIINLFLSFSGVGAILMLVISGIRLVLDPGSEENIEKHKKVVAYTAVGIIIIGMSGTLINEVIFPNGGYGGPNVRAFNVQLRGLSNYILGFLGGFIFVSLVISGVLMVVNQGDEEMWGKIKTTMKNILIGVTVVFSAYTIVATLIQTLITAGGGG